MIPPTTPPGYYSVDTSDDCGSDFWDNNTSTNTNGNNKNNTSTTCLPSLIPKPDHLYGTMTPVAHTPNAKLYESLATPRRFLLFTCPIRIKLKSVVDIFVNATWRNNTS
ncbi:hypothetical protein IV203_011341 [Nitzschia inconspicua]|uniref:Uncharacterized protein n=1 Tax=Nitzschia inconspicua TaxID=303405 RepID=A0A9K3KT01_9STRA|nr:hypothetical protein IV203_011341 [Nitzschia inconspicua]